MPSWIVDDPTLVLVLLGVGALVLALAWWLTRKRYYLMGAAALGVLALVVWLLYRFVPTDAKQIERNLQDMAAAVDAKDVNRLFSHVSDEFMFHLHNKADFRRGVEGYLRRGEVQGVTVWGFEVRELSRERHTAKVLFNAKGRGTAFGGHEYVRCKAHFVLDPDGEWRLKGFELYQPQIDPDQGEPLVVPFRS